LRISIEGIIFLLKPRIRMAFRTFKSLFLWSRLIWLTIFSYQSAFKGGYLILRAICSSKDSFTGNALLESFCFSCLPPPSSLFSCWFNWKSKKAYFLGFDEFQSLSGRYGSSISYLKNHPLKICRIYAAASSPPKYLLERS
jgi:hypothetical protein